jgi:hypothetical protein
MYLCGVIIKGVFPIKKRFCLSFNLSNKISDEDFKSRSSNGKKGTFSRNRKLGFESLIIFILQMGTKSLQRELDDFLKQIDQPDYNIRHVTKSALSQSRRKLNPNAFLELNETVIRDYYAGANYIVYNKHRVLAVDGSKVKLPKSKSITEEFGTTAYGINEELVSMANISMLYDTANLMTLDVCVESTKQSERALLLGHLSKTKPNDLLVLDRGYTGRAIMSIMLHKELQFCIRYSISDSQVKAFADSGLKEQTVEMEVPAKSLKEYRLDYPDMASSFKVRLIRVGTSEGNYKILATSLLNEEEYNVEDFDDLYKLRWGIEEAYKMLKSRAEVDAFTGKSPEIIRQDLFSKVLLMNLCAAWSSPIEEKVREEYKANEYRKYDQKINRTNALSATRRIITDVFINSKIQKAFDWFDRKVLSSREIIRPDRSVKRKKKPPKHKSMNYKRL